MIALVAAAMACPVCGGPAVENGGSYLAMTIMLSLLPLACIGGVGWWVRQQAARGD